jgi:hypothetical protein
MSKEEDARDNPAVQHCRKAWEEAYDEEMRTVGDDDDHGPAVGSANRAYLCALPPLSGYDNIRDFIACIMHALVLNVLDPEDVEGYLAGAKVALSALRQKPQRKRHQRHTSEKVDKSKKESS